MGTPKTGRAAREEREKLLILKHKYQNRITITKIGKQALDNGDYGTTIQRFVEYLGVMADIKEVKDIYSLKPSQFNANKDITEMLLISHIYFEMGRIYDAVPKFQEDSRKCLEQFVAFSVNQPFQVVNSELIRKHLKKSAFKNAAVFRTAYEQIYVQSKKCYIVTFCYGPDHKVTHDYQLLKEWLLENSAGREFVRTYYRLSSELVTKWENNRSMHLIGRFVFRPLLSLFSKTLLPLIIRKC